MKFTTYGDVRGQAILRRVLSVKNFTLAADQRGCAKQGGYSDRQNLQAL